MLAGLIAIGVLVGIGFGWRLTSPSYSRPPAMAWLSTQELLRWRQRPPGAWAEGRLPGLYVSIGYLMPLVLLLPAVGWLRGQAPTPLLLLVAVVPPGLWLGANLAFFWNRRGVRDIVLLDVGILNGPLFLPWELFGSRSDGPHGLIRLHGRTVPWAVHDAVRPPDSLARAELLRILDERGIHEQLARPISRGAQRAAISLLGFLVIAVVLALLAYWLPDVLGCLLLAIGTLVLMARYGEVPQRLFGLRLPRDPREAKEPRRVRKQQGRAKANQKKAPADITGSVRARDSHDTNEPPFG